MRVDFLKAIWAVGALLGAGLLSSAASAGDIQFVNYQEMQKTVSAQNERIAQLETRLASFANENAAAAAVAPSGDAGGCGCGGSCGCERTVYAGLDILFLKTHVADDIGANNPDNDYQPAYRFTLGTECEGLGGRIRFFDYFQIMEFGDDAPDAFVHIQNLDFELTDRFCLCNWHGLLSVGGRYMEFKTQRLGESTDNELVGSGPTIAVELSRCIRCDWEVYASVRESLLFGPNVLQGRNDMAAVTEIGTGIQRHRSIMCDCAQLTTKIGIEAQHYAGALENDSHDLGLFGGVISFTVSR